MASRPITTEGAPRPSNRFVAAMSLLIAAAIGSAPLWAVVFAGGV